MFCLRYSYIHLYTAVIISIENKSIKVTKKSDKISCKNTNSNFQAVPPSLNDKFYFYRKKKD